MTSQISKTKNKNYLKLISISNMLEKTDKKNIALFSTTTLHHKKHIVFKNPIKQLNFSFAFNHISK